MKPVLPPVEIRRVLSCPVSVAFGLWTDEEAVGRWMCPDPSVLVTRLDWRPEEGREYNIEMMLPDGPVHFSGSFLTVVPPRELTFTWVSTKTKHETTVVRVRLRAVHEGTLLTLVHEGLPDRASRDEHRGGWVNILDRLEESAADTGA